MDLRLALPLGGFLLVAGAERVVRHLAADLAGEQRLLQLLLLGAADAAAHLVVAVEAGGAGGGDQRTLGDGAVDELARHLRRQHLQQRAGRQGAQLRRQHLGGDGRHVRHAHLLPVDAGEQRVLGGGARRRCGRRLRRGRRNACGRKRNEAGDGEDGRA